MYLDAVSFLELFCDGKCIQCRSRPQRGTMDQIFVVRQILEKFYAHVIDLHLLFIDLHLLFIGLHLPFIDLYLPFLSSPPFY